MEGMLWASTQGGPTSKKLRRLQLAARAASDSSPISITANRTRSSRCRDDSSHGDRAVGQRFRISGGERNAVVAQGCAGRVGSVARRDRGEAAGPRWRRGPKPVILAEECPPPPPTRAAKVPGARPPPIAGLNRPPPPSPGPMQTKPEAPSSLSFAAPFNRRAAKFFPNRGSDHPPPASERAKKIPHASNRRDGRKPEFQPKTLYPQLLQIGKRKKKETVKKKKRFSRTWKRKNLSNLLAIKRSKKNLERPGRLPEGWGRARGKVTAV